MSRYIDADALKEKIDDIWANRSLSFLGARILTMIDNEPSIDIVHCGECKHRTYCYGDVLWTNKRQTVDIQKDIDFCSLGEREGE